MMTIRFFIFFVYLPLKIMMKLRADLSLTMSTALVLSMNIIMAMIIYSDLTDKIGARNQSSIVNLV